MEIGAYTSGGECVRAGEYGRGCGAGCHGEITSVVGHVRLSYNDVPKFCVCVGEREEKLGPGDGGAAISCVTVELDCS